MEGGAGAAAAIITRVPSRTGGKSRLGALLGPGHRLQLQRAFLLDTLAVVSAVGELDRYVAYHPPARGVELRELLGPGVALLPQRGVDLGQRLRHVAAKLALRYSRVLLLGSDSPTLQPSHLRQALLALERHDVCLGPAMDGGYYLIGLKRGPGPMFYGVDWGTDRVLAQTLRNAQAAGLSPHLLEPWYDVDTPADLSFLGRHVADLADVPGALSPAHTERLLRRLAADGVLPSWGTKLWASPVQDPEAASDGRSALGGKP